MGASHSGSCLCGSVQLTVSGDLKPGDACHCAMCRKTSGHFWASTNVPRAAISIADEAGALSWFQSSERVRRGFCGRCGSSLLWDPIHKDYIAVAMGAFDGPTGTRLSEHIFVEDKGDYYDICDGLPQNAR